MARLGLYSVGAT